MTPAPGRPVSTRGAVAVALTLSALLVVIAGVAHAVTSVGWGSVYLDEPVAGVVLAVVGGVLATRVPANPIGWLFLAGGSGGAVATLANAHVAASDAAGGVQGPWYMAAAAAGGSLWIAPFLVVPLLLLLFPSGRLRSRRWRLAAGVGATGTLLVLATMALAGVHWVRTGAEPPRGLFLLVLCGGAMVIVSLIAGLIHLGLRARAARGDERQQVRWLLAGGLATLLLVAVGFATVGDNEGTTLTLNEVIFAAALLPVPLATGVGVLRHRLYDLGRLVSRTVVYGVLTATLLSVYLSLVAFATLLTPASRTSPLAVAGSTLAAAALFRPLRTRVQALVDQRFNRRRYDASRVVESFRGQVRDQVDLETVTSGLVAAAHRTVQPSAVAVWLRGHRE